MFTKHYVFQYKIAQIDPKMRPRSTQDRPKTVLRPIQNSINFENDFLIDFWSSWGRFGVLLGRQDGAQNRIKSATEFYFDFFRRLLGGQPPPRLPQDPPRCPKSVQEGQNAPQEDQKRPQTILKATNNDAERAPRRQPLAYFYCISLLHIFIAYLYRISLSHISIAYLDCIYFWSYLHCISWLPICIAHLYCISLLHNFIACLYCISVLRIPIGYLHCTSWLHIFVAYLHCISVLQIFSVFFLCVSLWHIFAEDATPQT